jgi:hypothetical protein
MDEEIRSFEADAKKPQRGFLAEFVSFAFQNKKWWLTPIVILLLLLSGFIILGGSGAAPFIYSLF